MKGKLLSVLYIILLLVILDALNIGLMWVFNNLIFSVLNWFNRLNIIFKFLLLFVGGYSLFIWGLSILTWPSVILGRLSGNYFPLNLFTMLSSSLITLANAVYFIIQIWRVVKSYNFWSIIELLILSYIVLWINYSLVINKAEK